jgi:hypothetical protein
MRSVAISLFSCAALLAGACSGSDGGKKPPIGGSGAIGGSGGAAGSGGATAGSGGSGGAAGSGGATAGSGGGEAGSSGSGGTAVTPDAAPTPTPPPDASPSTPADPTAPCPRCVRIFNAMNFDGWQASTATWKIVEGAMHGQGGASRAAYTNEDYGNVRLIFSSRMNPVNDDHLGVLFWGNRPTNPEKPEINNAGWIQWMPNYGGLWSYYPPKDRGVPSTKVAPSPTDWTKWHQSELLLILDKGTLRAATDGVEVTRYTHPFPTERTDPTKRIIKGPIGMMKHDKGGSEYKDIWVEVDPTEDKLYTVK